MIKTGFTKDEFIAQLEFHSQQRGIDRDVARTMVDMVGDLMWELLISYQDININLNNLIDKKQAITDSLNKFAQELPELDKKITNSLSEISEGSKSLKKILGNVKDFEQRLNTLETLVKTLINEKSKAATQS